MGEYTVGVEEEYQLVDQETGELRSGALAVLAADWAGELKPELQQSQIEIGTAICAGARQVGAELGRLRLHAATAAASEGLSIVAAGLHPFSRWQEHKPSPGERYARIRERYGLIVKTEHIFGMHVHVAVPAEVDRTEVLSRARWYLPHLLALSASSPLHEGEDTGFASYRTVLTRRLSHSGPPPEFPSEGEYRRFLRLLADSGALEDEFTIYWSIRIHPRYPTVEFRGTDCCPRLEDTVAIAALVRAIVAGCVEGVLRPRPECGLPATARDALLSSNEFMVARQGLEASLPAPDLRAGSERVREGIRRLLDVVEPVASCLGDYEALTGVERILERGNGADRIRALRARGDDGRELVRCLAADTLLGTGLDRRREPRAGCAVEERVGDVG